MAQLGIESPELCADPPSGSMLLVLWTQFIYNFQKSQAIFWWIETGGQLAVG
jgi:hypothetical protein